MEPVIDVLLENVDYLVNHKKSFTSHPKTRGHTIQYVVDDNELCFLSAATDGFPQIICFDFLQDIMNEFVNNYMGRQKNKAFQKYLAERMDYFTNDPEANKISALKVKVAEVTDIMHENVERLLQRGEMIEGIEARAEDLRVKTSDFDKETRRIRCAMCMEHWKLTLCIIFIVLFFVALSVAIVAVLMYIIFGSGLVL